MPARDPSEQPDDEAMRARLESLPRGLSPERNLWPGIARRIERRQGRLVVLRRVALGGALAAAASFALYTGRAPRDVLPVVPPTPSVALAPSASAPSVGPLFPGEADYTRAADALLVEFEKERASMPAETARVLDENLVVVNLAIAACRSALVGDPDDPELRSSLDLAYEEKLDLLRTAVELPTGS
jgi:hypothetical protein